MSNLPSYRGGRSQRMDVFRATHPNDDYWWATAESEKRKCTLYLAKDIWNAILDDPRIPKSTSEQQFTYYFRHIHTYLLTHDKALWTVDNLVTAAIVPQAEA